MGDEGGLTARKIAPGHHALDALQLGHQRRRLIGRGRAAISSNSRSISRSRHSSISSLLRIALDIFRRRGTVAQAVLHGRYDGLDANCAAGKLPRWLQHH